MPTITVNRQPFQAEIIVEDYQGQTVFLERSPDYDGLFAEIATFSESSYIDEELNPSLRYKYRITMNDVEGSVSVVGDFTFEVPPYYEVEPVGDATFDIIDTEFDIPWGSNITIPLIRIGNLRRTKHSRQRFSF